MSAEMHETPPSTHVYRSVDNTDWLKTVAIILVLIDHTGYFFIENADWWSVIGRLAAPTFFFLLGYTQTRTVPFNWIWLGVLLTLLDSCNSGWIWVAPNILFSFALIRVARPHVKNLLQNHGWVAFIVLVAILLTVLPVATNIVEYGAEGWLWALFGLCQRMHIDSRSATAMHGTSQGLEQHAPKLIVNAGLMRLLACIVTSTVYVWQEQGEFSFSQNQLTALIIGVGILSICLYVFHRGPSCIQPPESIAGSLRFIGRRTLEIYAIQLAIFEVVILLVPDLAP